MPRPLPTGEILEQILTPHGIKSLPPINQLLMEPFFKVGRGVVVERGGKSVASGGGRVMRDAVMRHERRRAAKKALPHASTAPGPIAHTLPHPWPRLQEVELGQVEKGSFKLSSRVKDGLVAAYKAAHTQMRTAQAAVRGRA